MANDEWGYNLADNVAERNEGAVKKVHQQVQWTTVSALTALATTLGAGEMYIRYQQGHSKGTAQDHG